MSFEDGILKENNKQPYIDLVMDIEKYGRACAIHTTYKEKMYLALKWLNDNIQEPFTYIAPNKAMLNQFMDLILIHYFKDAYYSLKDLDIKDKVVMIRDLFGNENLNFFTYYNLNKMEDNEMEQLNIKKVVLYDFYLAGAEKWSESIFRFLKAHKDCQLMGLSSVSVRHEDKKDMVELLFNGRISTQIDLSEAIEKKILPFPKMVYGIYSFKPIIDSLERRLNERNIIDEKVIKEIKEKIAEARKLIGDCDGVEEIFKQYLSSNGKFVVCCSSIKDMKEKMEECEHWVKDGIKVKVYGISTDENYKENIRQIEQFENESFDGIQLLFCVNMLNEGIYVKNVNGVIMLRNTRSMTLFLQQLGSVLAMNNNDSPWVFTLFDNRDLMRKEMERFRAFAKGIDTGDMGNEKYGFAIQASLLNIVDYLETTLAYYTSSKIRYDIFQEYCKDEKHKTLANVKTNEIFVYNGKPLNIGNMLSVIRFQYYLRTDNVTSSRLHPLSDEEVKEYEAMGVVWRKHEVRTYEEKLEILKQYCQIDEEGNVKVSLATISSDDEYDGYAIGSWIDMFRQAYANRELPKEKWRGHRIPLTDDEVRHLEELGMVWKMVYTFEEKLEILKEYCDEKEKTLADVDKNDSYGIYPIGKWIELFRRKYVIRNLPKEKWLDGESPLTDEQVKVLEKMGMVWKKQYTFEEKMVILKKYCQDEETTLASIKGGLIYKGFPIGGWKATFKTAYKYRNVPKEKRTCQLTPLSDAEVKQLEDLGMDWISVPKKKGKGM